MFSTALSLFLLRKLSFKHFEFPRWQAILGITAIGVLAGIDPSFRLDVLDVLSLPAWLSIPFALATTWAGFLIIVGVLRWWMRRGDRWDGGGDFFNLVAASELIGGILSQGLSAVVGFRQTEDLASHLVQTEDLASHLVMLIVMLILSLYSLWVVANALSGAIPKASRGYCIGGIFVGSIPIPLAGLLLASVLG